MRSIARRSLADPEAKLAWLLIVSTIPAALVGVLFESFIEDRLGKPWIIAVAMIVFAGFMYLIDHLAKLDRDIEHLSWFDALLIGVAQALALFPGVSRSGITMMTGLAAAPGPRVGRALLVPAEHPGHRRRGRVQGARGRQGRPAGRARPCRSSSAWSPAAFSGIAAIWFVLAYLKRHNFNLFVRLPHRRRRGRAHPDRRRRALGHGHLTRSFV